MCVLFLYWCSGFWSLPVTRAWRMAEQLSFTGKLTLLVWVSIAVMTHQATWEGKGLVHPTVLDNSSSSKAVRAGADTEAVEGCCLLCMACSACSLTEPRTGLPRSTVGWARPHQSQIKKMPYRISCSLILCRHLLS